MKEEKVKQIIKKHDNINTDWEYQIKQYSAQEKVDKIILAA